MAKRSTILKRRIKQASLRDCFPQKGLLFYLKLLLPVGRLKITSNLFWIKRVNLRYWSIWCVSPASETLGYQNAVVPLAQDFVRNQFPRAINASVQSVLQTFPTGFSKVQSDLG